MAEPVADAADIRPAARRRALGPGTVRRIQLTLFTIVLLVVWEAIVRAFKVPDYLVPPPSAVAVALYRGLSSGLFFGHFAVTLYETVSGFALAAAAGIVVGTLIAQSRLMEQFVYPYIVALQSLPKIAIAPLIIVWLGYGFTSKIVVAATVAFFPVLVNVIVGLKSVDQDRIDLMRSLKASRWQQLKLVQLPNALPFIFAGLDVAAIFSLLGAIVAEFVGSQEGLGNLILIFNQSLDIASVFACLVVLGLMGTCLHLVIQHLQKRMIFWSATDDVLRI